MNEVNRLKILQDVIDGRLTTSLASLRLGITDRHCRHLLARYRKSGPLALANHRRALRGKPGTHRIDESLRHRILTLLRENYVGVGPYLPQKNYRNATGSISDLLHPIFQHQTRYSRKLPGIICHQDNAGRNGMTGNSRVIRAYRCSGCAQGGLDLSGGVHRRPIPGNTRSKSGADPGTP